MLSVADYAEGLTDDEGNEILPPPDLLQAFRVEQWGAAALYDEPIPAGEIHRMTVCLNVYKAFLSYRAGSNDLPRWVQSNPQASEIVMDIRRMRMETEL